jgi:hypothetical protein
MTSPTFGRVQYAGDRWLLSDVAPHVAIRLKHIFPRIPREATSPFSLSADRPTAADLHWFMQRYPLAISDQDLAEMQEVRLAYGDDQARLETIFTPDWRPPALVGIKDGQVLRPYQQQAVAMLGDAKGLLLGDEVGLGKTFIGAGACLLPGALPAAVVCQPHLQRQWERVIGEFTTLRTCPIKGTTPYPLPGDVDVFIWRYTQLRGWIDTFKTLGLKLAIFDEVQELRGGTDTGKGQAAMKMARSCRYALGLTATPIYNYGREIWTIMSFIRGDVLGAHDDFVREWCPAGPVKDPKALGSFLRAEHAFLRRTKADVGQQLPAVSRIVDTIDYERVELANVEDIARELAVRATSHVEVLERGRAVRELDLLMRKVTGVAKAKAVAKIVRVLVDGGEPVVLVGWHRDVYDIWLKAFEDLKPAMYTGSETPKAKNDSVVRFLSGETPLFIMSLRSGAGLDGLQKRCSTMVFGELDWSPGVHHQCIGRLDREGQEQPVTAMFLVCDDGSDPPMMEVLGLKASEAAHIVDPNLGVQTVKTDGSHLRSLVQRYLDKQGVTAEPPADWRMEAVA